uniref:Voltage-dependent anion-selective channel protein 2 n=1 Tax=Scolopendra viridis TaxID=118503 RepID=A0A4D5R9M8_SCOVI
MPAPPQYTDLGKQARDLFNKGYHFGLVKLETKTKTRNGVEFTVTGNHHLDTGKVCGSLETKYKLKEWCMSLTEKWNTDNTLQTEVTLEDGFLKCAPGLKITLDTSFAPQSGKKTGRVKSSYKSCYLALNGDVDFDPCGPIVHGAAVLGYCGWLAGYQMAFDTGRSKLCKSNFAVGYCLCDFVLHTNVNDGQEFGGSIYQKVNEHLETGVQLGWTAGSNATRFSLGCKYKLDKDSSFSVKVNNVSQVGLGFTQRLRDGINMTLSAMIDGKNFNSGCHKIGMALDLEASIC